MARAKKIDRDALTRIIELADGFRDDKGEPADCMVSLSPDLADALGLDDDDEFPPLGGGGREISAKDLCAAADSLEDEETNTRRNRRAKKVEEEVDPSDPENTAADREASRLNPGERTNLNADSPRVPGAAHTPQADKPPGGANRPPRKP